MKKLLFLILLVITSLFAKSQNLRGYNVEAFVMLETHDAFVIGQDTFLTTTQLSTGDTVLVSLEYLRQAITDSLASYRIDINLNTNHRLLDNDLDPTNEIQDTTNIDGLLQYVQNHSINEFTETDPIYSSDSANIVWFSDLLDNNPSNEIQDLSGIRDSVLANTGKDTTGIFHANRAALDLVSGINTGDQYMSISNDTIYLTDGGYVVLPSSEAQVLYSNSSPGNIAISDGNSININVNDGDTSTTNEIQILTISNDTLFLTGGGYVVLPASEPEYSVDATYVPYDNGSTFVNSGLRSNGSQLSLGAPVNSAYDLYIKQTSSGYGMKLENSYTGSQSNGLFIDVRDHYTAQALNINDKIIFTGTGKINLSEYGAGSLFTGTVENYLAVDAFGGLIVASGTSGSGDDWGSQVAQTTGFIEGTGVSGNAIDLSATGTASSSTFLRGDNTWASPGSSSSPLTTKGDIYTYSTVDARLPVGANGYVLSANSSTATGLEWVSAGTGLWGSGTYGIHYTSGNVAIGRSALSASNFDSYTTSSTEYAGTFSNTSSSGYGVYIEQAGTLRPYLTMESEFAFLTGGVLAWADGSTPGTPATNANYMYVSGGVPYWKDDTGTSTSMIQGGAGYTLPTATDAVLGGVKTSSTGGTMMSGDYIIQNDLRLSTATPLTTDYIGFWDVSGNAQRRVTISDLLSLGGGGGSGTVTSVGAGNGMDFSTITTTGDVVLGTPSSITSTSTNSVTATSHTHAITGIPLLDNSNSWTEYNEFTTSRSGGAINVTNTHVTGTGIIATGGVIGISASGNIGVNASGEQYDLRLDDSGVINISSFATPPATATSSGMPGTVIITADYIYVCTATNTWKRVALSTW